MGAPPGCLEAEVAHAHQVGLVPCFIQERRCKTAKRSTVVWCKKIGYWGNLRRWSKCLLDFLQLAHVFVGLLLLAFLTLVVCENAGVATQDHHFVTSSHGLFGICFQIGTVLSEFEFSRPLLWVVSKHDPDRAAKACEARADHVKCIHVGADESDLAI